MLISISYQVIPIIGDSVLLGGFETEDGVLVVFSVDKTFVECRSDEDLSQSKPSSPLCRVGHYRRFTDQWDQSFRPVSLLPPSLLSCISAVVIIHWRPHYLTSILLSPSYCLYSTSLLPHVSAAISYAVLIHRPCRLACLHPLSSSTRVSPECHHPPPSPQFRIATSAILIN